jgi:2-haloacid dehalogenase
MTDMALRWVLFDMNGTLLDPTGIAAALGGEEQHRDLVEEGFREALLQSMADTLAGGYRPLPEYLRAALERRLLIAGDGTERLDAAMQKASAMDPFPEAAEALDLLRAGGLELAVLTNSATDSAEASLERAGLRDRFAVVAGSEAVRVFKPHPAVYRHGLAVVGAEPTEACMVAAHGWDLMGAKRVGLATAWVSRSERHLLATLPDPDVRADDLVGAADRILRRARR